MIKCKLDKYKKAYAIVYREKILPQKKDLKNTPDTFKADLKVMEDYAILRQRANEVVLGGEKNGEK